MKLTNSNPIHYIIPILLLIANLFAVDCPEEGSCDFISEIRIKKYLLSLPDSSKGKSINIFNYCHNIDIFKDHIFIEKIIDNKSKRNIFVFKRPNYCGKLTCEFITAYVWIEPNGKPISIPDSVTISCGNCIPESAYSLMGNSYVGDRIRADGCVAVITYVSNKWLEEIKAFK